MRLTWTMTRRLLSALLVATALLAAHASAAESAIPACCVFSATAGFRHDSIPAGVAAIRSARRTPRFAVERRRMPRAFTDRRLGRYAAVVSPSTRDVLDRAQQAAFRRYIRRGGGYAGVHAAADTGPRLGLVRRLLGAPFDRPPAIQSATIRVVDRRHPSTRGLPRRWTRTDEWYDYRAQPRRGVRVLALLDESTYAGGSMGARHPIAWCRRFQGGRSWYTGGGHTADSYDEPLFRAHLLGGIRWAAGRG